MQCLANFCHKQKYFLQKTLKNSKNGTAIYQFYDENMKKTIGSILFLLIVTACSSAPKIDFAEIENAKIGNNIFQQRLHAGYLRLAKAQQEQGDYQDAKHFANKARALARGIEPGIEELYQREIPLSHINEVLGAKYFLEAAFVKGVKNEEPEASAKAQVMLDCWIEQIEDATLDNKKKTSGFCKQEMLKASAVVNEVLDAIDKREAGKAKRLIAIEKQKFEAARQGYLKKLALEKRKRKKLPEYNLIFFKFNDVKLGLTAQNILKKVAKEIPLFKPRKVIVSGHTDNVGSYNYNIKLAMKRGYIVRDYLVSLGINPELIDVKAYGKNKPRDTRSNKPKNVRNRYVKVTFMLDNRVYYR